MIDKEGIVNVIYEHMLEDYITFETEWSRMTEFRIKDSVWSPTINL